MLLVLEVIVVQPVGLHMPPEHPVTHVTKLDAYPQLPAEQVPVAA